MIASYAAAIFVSPFSLWFWFPLSFRGIKAGLIFLSVLMVFVLRIANLRTASRQAQSPAYAFLKGLRDGRRWQTLLWYALSAWLFVEVYIWSAAPAKQLSLINPGKPYERKHLNERAIYLRTLFISLGFWQAGYHLWFDLDRVDVLSSRESLNAASARASLLDHVSNLATQGFPMVRHGLSTLIYMTPIAPFAYTLLLRRFIWYCSFAVTGIFVELPKHQKLTRFPPFLSDLLVVFWAWGLTLIVLWSIANVAFNTYIVYPPLNKENQPLTSDSKDPNGTLIAGLKSNREFVSTSAFAELLLITQEDQSRRESIYKQLDRTGGSTWTQILTICLGQLHGISKRINDYRNPPKPSPPMPEQLPGDVNHLPKMAAPIKQDNVLASSPPPSSRFVSGVDAFARTHGNHAGAEDPLSPQARKLLTASSHALLNEKQREAITPAGAGRIFRKYSCEILTLPYIGAFFRLTFARRASAIVIGEPDQGGTSESVIAKASVSLATLAARSAQEDHSGRASKDIATIIRTYVATIASIEDFIAWLEPHWSDARFQDKRAPDVENVVRHLKAGLKMILEAFDGYSELNLTIKEKRIAREKAGMVTDGEVFLEHATMEDGASRHQIGRAAEMRERRRIR